MKSVVCQNYKSTPSSTYLIIYHWLKVKWNLWNSSKNPKNNSHNFQTTKVILQDDYCLHDYYKQRFHQQGHDCDAQAPYQPIATSDKQA